MISSPSSQNESSGTMTIAPRDERENPVLHANPDTNHKRAQATMIDEKPPGKQSMATERTFDSADNLLGSEQDNNEKRPILPMNEVLPSTVASTIASPQPFTCRTFWDVRAIQWPPRHPLDSLECAWKYFQSPFHATEVAVLGTFLLLCYKLPDFIVEAHYRPIPYQTTDGGSTLIDLTFANPYHHNETIPGSLLALLTVCIPIAIFFIVGNCLGPRGDFHAVLCMYLLAMASKIFVVAIMKNYAGYFRPSFYNMCQFNKDTLVCDDETTSARESFPSGHAATALSSMTMVALFLLGKVRGGTRQRGVSAKPLTAEAIQDCIWTPSLLEKPLAVLAVSPMVLGIFIATSRVRDNWHHPADVICGGIIGIACALFAHSLWFPSVYSYYAGIPLETVRDIVTEKKARSELGAANEMRLNSDDDDLNVL